MTSTTTPDRSWRDSFISAPRFPGYDFVVAVTQASINTTMKTYLASLQQPIVTICYVAGTQPGAAPTEITLDELLKRTGGVDPFTIEASADPETDPRLASLRKARFVVAFRARIGIPVVQDPSKLPHIVVLKGGTSQVQFNMLCSEFSLAYRMPGSDFTPAIWYRLDQTPEKPWYLTAFVDLRLSTLDDTGFRRLSKEVQEKIKVLDENAFSIQQLLFDLSNPALSSLLPDFPDLDTTQEPYKVLRNFFVDKYITELKKQQLPLLGCIVVLKEAAPTPEPSLKLSDFNFHVNPYRAPGGPTDDQLAKLNTLNYLCRAQGVTHDNLPLAAVDFNWNWVAEAEQQDHHGVIAINRNVLANFIKTQIEKNSHPRRNCYQPKAKCYHENGNLIAIQFAVTEWKNGVEPKVEMPATGPRVLFYSHYAEDSDEDGTRMALGRRGELIVRTSYELEVTFNKNIITIRQRLVCFIYARQDYTDVNGNFIDRTVTDIFTLGIDEFGKLAPSVQKFVSDNPTKNMDAGSGMDFFSKVNGPVHNIKENTEPIVHHNLTNIPLDVVQDFVFPAGRTFLFKRAEFSDNQDLVGHITYADPS